MKKIIGIYENKHMHWVGDGFPVYNLFSYDRLGQSISPFLLLDYAAPYGFAPTTEHHGELLTRINQLFIRIAVKPRGLARGYKAAIR